MGIRITGIDVPVFGGASWEYTKGDKEVARAVVTFLEDRRVLFGARHQEDQSDCVRSVLAIREFLTRQITNSASGKDLEESLRTMRGACRRFLDAGGPDGRDFVSNGRHYQTIDLFSLALGDLRTSFGYQIAAMLSQYPMPVEPELASILPQID